jgi:diguanylate cyclase (GGDEF)-like protein/PAS domain S-box-containing protein
MSDSSGRRIYLNQAGRRMLGLSDGEPHLEEEFVRVHPPEVAAYLNTVAMPAAIRDGAWSGEGALLTRRGEVIPVSQVIIAHKEPDGRVEYFATIQRDIRPQKQAEAALREQEEFFRSAFEDAPIGMALLDPKGQMLRVNAALASMLGYTPEELVAAGRTAITPLDERRGRAGELPGVAAPIHREKRYLHKEGHEVWGYLSTSLVTDGTGQPLYYISHVEDITERKEYERQLMHLASYDPLTELFNRRRFQEELETVMAAANLGELRGAILFIDLDQFKYVNDTLGHHAGDELLTNVANLLRSLYQTPGCTVARLGGDEFAVILAGATPEAAELAADSLVALMQSFAPEVAGQQVRITASVGIALFPDHGTSAAELLARADFAMYQAKEHGRNRAYLFAPDADAVGEAEAKLTWERRIREAIEQDRFALWYQPILDLQTGQAEHCELLLRMTGEDGEPIAPGLFLPVAERFGLIQTIDRWVVREAIRLLARAQADGRWRAVEVNLSGLAFQDSELISLIQHELAATGADPAGLIMEITETAAIADLDAAREFVVTLRNLGCRFAIDDFGSGFASFAYLKHLPVDYLKIDGSFIRNLATDPVDQHLVRGMVEVARGLGRQTIAEFVGDEETVRLLREYGVDYAQGYHVGRPRPYNETAVPE